MKASKLRKESMVRMETGFLRGLKQSHMHSHKLSRDRSHWE